MYIYFLLKNTVKSIQQAFIYMASVSFYWQHVLHSFSLNIPTSITTSHHIMKWNTIVHHTAPSHFIPRHHRYTLTILYVQGTSLVCQYVSSSSISILPIFFFFRTQKKRRSYSSRCIALYTLLVLVFYYSSKPLSVCERRDLRCCVVVSSYNMLYIGT